MAKLGIVGVTAFQTGSPVFPHFLMLFAVCGLRFLKAQMVKKNCVCFIIRVIIKAFGVTLFRVQDDPI